MKNDILSINKPMLVKALIISFVLLAVAFTAGIVLGKSDKTLLDRTSADSGDVQEQLSDCSYRLQEITTKHLDMVKIAKRNGLIDNDGQYDPDVVCAKKEEPKEEPDESAAKEEIPDADVTAKPAKPAKPEQPVQLVQPEKKEIKKQEPVEKTAPSGATNCLFSIQLFSGTSKEQAVAAQKKYKISGTRLVEGIVKEKSWYRIRYGCFSTKAEAEKFLPGIKSEIDDAIVVGE